MHRTDFRKRHSVFRRSRASTNKTKKGRRRMERQLILQVIMLPVLPLIRLFGFVRSANRTVIRRSYVLPSLLLICNDVSDRLLHEPRRYKSSTYLITYIYIHTSHFTLFIIIPGGPLS